MQKEHYNKAYQKFTPEMLDNQSFMDGYLKQNSDSLQKFYQQYKNQFQIDASNMNCLELGCGMGAFSKFLNSEFKSFLGVDFSEEAIIRAKQLHPDLEFIAMDILKQKVSAKFDFIVDSHLYHCLITDEQRSAYLRFVKDHLKSDGKLLIESMVFQEHLQIPVGYYFDEKFILSQDLDGELEPIRALRKSIDIEEDFKNSELSLNYFYYHNELCFNPFSDYPDYPAQYCPKTIRMAATLNL